MSRCAHRYCAECTTAYVDSALTDGKLHLRCPGATASGLCAQQLDMNHVRVFASPGVLGGGSPSNAS